MAETVVCFLRSNGKVLMSRRRSVNGEEWDVPTADGGSEGDGTARDLCREWAPGETTLVRAGDPVLTGGSRLRPYLFDCEAGDGGDGNERETVWMHAPELLRGGPAGRWRAYRAVAPTVETVRDDHTHGSAYISIRALEVLRDRAAEGAGWSALVGRATDLLDARPSMAALGNRINRAMSEASAERSAVALEDAAKAGIDRAVEADGRAAERAAERIGGTVLTLSRSGTVRGALLAAEPERVVVLESRPDREGVGVAGGFAGTLDVTVTLDAAVSHAMQGVDHVLVGADTVLADGSVVNKVGTRTAAVAAAREGVPVYAVAAVDKISPARTPVLESIDRDAVTDDGRVAVDCPLFDRTPPDLLAGAVTEDGVLDAAAVGKRAAEHERRSRWKEPNGSAKKGRRRQ